MELYILSLQSRLECKYKQAKDNTSINHAPIKTVGSAWFLDVGLIVTSILNKT